MYNTNYHRVSSVEDAISKMGSADDGKFVSGGQTLIPTMKQRLAAPSDLIDLRHVDSMKSSHDRCWHNPCGSKCFQRVACNLPVNLRSCRSHW